MVSMMSKKLMQKQLNRYKNRKGYRKGYSSQFTLMALIEKSKICLDQKRYTEAVLMDFLRAFDTVNLKLLIAELYVYDFSKDAVEVILSYPSNRLQCAKINTTFSYWIKLTQGYLKDPYMDQFYSIFI